MQILKRNKKSELDGIPTYHLPFNLITNYLTQVKMTFTLQQYCCKRIIKVMKGANYTSEIHEENQYDGVSEGELHVK